MHLSTKKKWEIIFLSQHRRGPHLSNTHIAKEVSCDIKTVKYWINRYKLTGDVAEEKSTGRPRATTPKQDKKIISLHRSHPNLPTIQLQRQLKKKKLDISQSTITRKLHEAGLKFIPPIPYRKAHEKKASMDI